MIFKTEPTELPDSIFGENSQWLKVCLFVMFLLAALVRRDEIHAPGHLIDREYNSAIFAHAFYVSGNNNVEQWRKDIAFATRDQHPMLEPPVTEYLVSIIYRIVGREEIWYSRYLTSLFWLVGGLFLYKIVRALSSVDAAMIAVGYYLFVPWGIIISRSFQPDALMMMMYLLSLYVMVLYFEKPSYKSLALAGILTGITLLLRPLVLFTLYGGFVAMSIHKKGERKNFIDNQFIAFGLLSLIFPLAFYGYGIYIAGFLQGQAELSFRPYLLSHLEFWRGWLHLGVMVAGLSFLIFAILGYFTLHNRLTRFLIAGLTIGYLIFGLFFTFHVHTHPYYHIQLFPIIAICAAPFLAAIMNSYRRLVGNNWWVPIAACVLAVSYFSWREERSTLYTVVFEDPSLAKEIGEMVGHSIHTVYVSFYYGLPLEYYGELTGTSWPVSIDDPFYRRPDARELSVQERLDGLGFTPEYFVITNFNLYNRKHQDLQEYLENNCSSIEKTDAYLIYSKCTKVTVK